MTKKNSINLRPGRYKLIGSNSFEVDGTLFSIVQAKSGLVLKVYPCDLERSQVTLFADLLPIGKQCFAMSTLGARTRIPIQSPHQRYVLRILNDSIELAPLATAAIDHGFEAQNNKLTKLKG